MKLHLPTYMGGDEVEIAISELLPNEEVVGWVDSYGTIISSRTNQRIGDLIPVLHNDYYALVMVKDDK